MRSYHMWLNIFKRITILFWKNHQKLSFKIVQLNTIILKSIRKHRRIYTAILWGSPHADLWNNDLNTKYFRNVNYYTTFEWGFSSQQWFEALLPEARSARLWMLLKILTILNMKCDLTSLCKVSTMTCK